ncbi:hypothetical protein QZH41_009789 [Actinostola sp. cb2023]|nr:hypothetical protein QZH41_009789 [Actinostola sp. cb2023]
MAATRSSVNNERYKFFYALNIDGSAKSDNRMRGRVSTYFRAKFETLNSAEEHYNLTLASCLQDLVLNVEASTSTYTNLGNVPVEVKDQINLLCSHTLLDIADFCFLKLVNLHGINSNPIDFISRALTCMKVLQQHGKSNLLYKFAFCLTEKQPGMDKPLLALNRMPFGLLEYQLEFFSCTNIMQITVPHDFKVWYETLCSEFPTRFARLFRGPMWSGLPMDQQKYPLTVAIISCFLVPCCRSIHAAAKVNIAAAGIRTVQKATASSDFTCEPGLQSVALKLLKEAHPKGRFWLKTDACDLKAALQQSVQGVWNGDCDLGDGKLQQFRQEFQKRTSSLDVDKMGMNRDVFEEGIRSASDALSTDITFLADGLNKANDVYQVKFNTPNTPHSTLMHLCWETVEFNTLLQQSQAIQARLDNLLPHLNPANPRIRAVSEVLRNMAQELKSYFRNLYVKKRQPAATHVLVIMVSEERRNKKPYALPVQFVPYHSIRDQYIRDLSKSIKEEMTTLGMKVVGMVTDGEFNSLRTQGETRPVHIWQVIHNVRESVSRQKERTLLKMLTKICEDANGDPITEIHDEAMPKTVIQELHYLRLNNGWSMEDAVTYLRGKLVPPEYTPFPFRANTPESYLDKLRSLVATYRFRHTLKQFQEDGIDFSLYLYVPETDPTTGEVFHEREDHCHILKRIWKHT